MVKCEVFVERGYMKMRSSGRSRSISIQERLSLYRLVDFALRFRSCLALVSAFNLVNDGLMDKRKIAPINSKTTAHVRSCELVSGHGPARHPLRRFFALLLLMYEERVSRKFDQILNSREGRYVGRARGPPKGIVTGTSTIEDGSWCQAKQSFW